ncbi:MAG TPA: ABC transporter permease [Azospirillaceae bacterium]|nr:ABC transporter permease [Azospirillaceae bacterium]
MDAMSAGPAAARPAASRPVTLIGGRRPGLREDAGELWRHRGLFAMLVWRILAVRYKQTLVGSAWAVLQPFLLMLVFTVFFGWLVRIPSDGVPYPLFFFTGLWMWSYLSQCFLAGAASVVANGHIVGKVYFPRALLPAATVAASVVDFLVGLPALAALMAWYGIVPGWGLLAFPAAFLIATAMGLGLALWFAATWVFYRDTAYLLPFLAQLWMFASPVIYPLSLVPAEWRELYALNPMVGVAAATRWAFAGGPPVEPRLLLVSAGAALLVLATGYRYFRRREPLFTDHA